MKSRVKVLFTVWAGFTLTLLVWWVIFSLKQLNKLKELNLQNNYDIVRYQRMLTYEGVSLFVCLLIGAGALFYYITRENKYLRERRNFLSLFTHDLKTTISSLRLVIEKLSNKKIPEIDSELKQVQQIGNKLGQQLQNALQISVEKENKFYFENVDFNTHLKYISPMWVDLEIEITDKIYIFCDALALRSMLTNIIQNAIDHADAKKIIFKKKDRKNYTGVLCITPEGRSFTGNIESFKLDKKYTQSVDGTGLGLKLTEQMMRKMGGFVEYTLSDQGSLQVALFFKKETSK